MTRRPGAALVIAVTLVLAACGGANSATTTLAGTRAPGEQAASSTAAVASTTPSAPAATTTAKGPTDVTLGGATQVTAAPGTTGGRSASSTVPIAASTPAGFQRAADPEGTVSVAVPTSWTIVPLDDRTLEQLANQSGAFPPETRAQLQNAVAQAGEYMKVLAVGPPDASGTSPNVNVVVVPGSSPVSALKAVYPQQVQAFGGTIVSTEDLAIDSRPAVRFVLKLKAAAGEVTSIQVVVPVEAKTLILSFANVEPALLGSILNAVVIPKR